MPFLLVLFLALNLSVSAQATSPVIPSVRSKIPIDPIGKVTAAKLMELDRDGQFNPQRVISRAELATILVRTFNLNRRRSNQPPIVVQDVPRNHWAYDSIQAVLRTGIMRGYDRGLFYPNQRINRAEAIATFANAYGVFQFPDATIREILAKYPDAKDLPSWSRRAVATALYEGLVDVDDQNRIRPLEPMTRLDMAKMLSLYLSLKEEGR